ncbi:MAG TPA: hypothetical protein VGC54_08520 [Planctomycetota bacterium]
MFDRPLGLGLLLFAVPLWFWARRNAPRQWLVGGLDPFAFLPASTGTARRVPLSLLAGLLALAAASIALAGPRLSSARGLCILDASFSHLALADAAALEASRSRHSAVVDADLVVVGGPAEPAAEAALFDALRRAGAGRPWRVLTDRPRPLGCPDSVVWETSPLLDRTPPVPENAALLAAWHDAAGLHLHWANWGAGTTLAVEVGAGGPQAPLEGMEGTVLLALPAHSVDLRLIGAPAAGSAAQRADDSLAWTHYRVRLAAGADPAWVDVLGALLPGSFELVAELDTDVDFAVTFGAGLGDLLPADPFRNADPLAALEIAAAALARHLPSVAPARARKEVEPDLHPRQWPADLTATTQSPVPGGERWFAGAGVVLYALALLLRARGR